MTIVNDIESQVEAFGNKVAQMQGELKTLKSQQEDRKNKVQQYIKDEETYIKAVELLSLVQKVTRDKVKDSFETIVTHALNYIFQSDKYKFELVFTKRGNLPELKFAVKTPDKDEAFDTLDTDGGGVNNILSFALRIVLMEISHPRTQGFIISDESFANLSEEHIESASKFLKEINQKMNRQIIAISHQPKMLDSADKLIEVK